MRPFARVTIFAVAMALAFRACADPIVPGYQVTVYGSVVDPVNMRFAPDGTMFVGTDNSGSGGSFLEAVKIHRVSVGGSSVTEYGADSIFDPDSVAFAEPICVGRKIVEMVWSGWMARFPCPILRLLARYPEYQVET